MAPDPVVPLADLLRARRQELGISQSQAARELDVARTAYRLWELEAAKPAPDRWRLIARWLGVSMTTMLLAERLLSADEASEGSVVHFDFGRTQQDETTGAANDADFFTQACGLLLEGVESGDIGEADASRLQLLFDRIAADSSQKTTRAWETAELRKSFPADVLAPRHARTAMAAVGVGLPEADLEIARVLISELVTNSVIHGSTGEGSTVGVFIGVGRDRLRVEVSDESQTKARPRTPTPEGGYGLALVAELASRWGAGRENGVNVTWFELDLPLPGD
jgi:transcriptional regulator with XRE-family HTH domain/anti-sigma regulatory factor (Ser/Thr protein kinase)